MIWYQGETNAESAQGVALHGDIFPRLVHDWREQWNRPELPFLFVQLPAMDRPHWPAFRNQQRRFLKTLSHTGMATAIDTGERTNVHPTKKKPVGERLAAWAFGEIYKSPDRETYSGPLMHGAKFRDGAIAVRFQHCGGGLTSSDGEPLRHFEVAARDGVFFPAIASIQGTQVIVSSPEVDEPQIVRYAWAPFPDPPVNFFNIDGLPAAPFTVSGDHPKKIGAVRNHRPNVLLIVSEDNGAELGCYGDPYVRTPNLDKLAQEGCRFANAYVPHAVCSASRAAFLTGLYPFQNGQIGLATHRYAMYREWDNIPGVLKTVGYRTGMIGKLHVNPESAFSFDYRAITGNGFNDRPMELYAAAADRFFNASDEPFFLAINYPDAHFPLLRQQYGLPVRPLEADDVTPLPFIGADSPRLRQGTADYYNCLMRLDSGIGMLMDRLERSGKADNTIVIYIGDHGAQFSRGKATCYEGGLRIPMIIRSPGVVPPNTVRNELVSTIDLLPTILDAVRLPARETLPGTSLLPLANGKADVWRRYLFAERTAYSAGSFYPQRTLRDERYKLILNLTPTRTNPVADAYLNQDGPFFVYGTNRKEINAGSIAIQSAYATWRIAPAVELYDLENDPWEFVNLADSAEHKTAKRRLMAELQHFREQHKDPLLNAEKLRQLEAEHDYVASATKRGRYGEGQSWKYLDYLQQTAP